MNQNLISELHKSKDYLENLIQTINDGPTAFNASEPVMQHLNSLWGRFNQHIQAVELSNNRKESILCTCVDCQERRVAKQLKVAAKKAATTGNRRDLADYLKLRRELL